MHGRRDLLRINRMMEDYNIDIGVFQEMETRKSRGGATHDINQLAGANRPHHLPGLALTEDEGWYGNLVVSRYPILRGVVHDLKTPISYEPRNAIDALIDTPFGHIRIIGTHLSLAPWQRWPEINNLLALMDEVEAREKKPLLLMGDINEWRAGSRPLRHLNKLMKPIRCGRSFPSSWPVFHLDRVWHDNCPFQVQARTIKTKETKHYSDHLPLLITLG